MCLPRPVKEKIPQTVGAMAQELQFSQKSHEAARPPAPQARFGTKTKICDHRTDIVCLSRVIGVILVAICFSMSRFGRLMCMETLIFHIMFS